MKKIKYFAFSIILLFTFLIQPNKQVKAQSYPVYLLRGSYYDTRLEQENAYTYEFIVAYKFDNIFIDTLNGYFLITERYIALQKGINRNRNSYIIEGIYQEINNITIISIRVTLNKNFIDDEFSIEFAEHFFRDYATLYIEYDIYTDAYMDGYEIGYEEGRDRGYGEGYIDGHSDGYNTGYNDGLNDNQGFELGYNKGKNEGFQSGYDEGHWDGYNSGYNNGYYTGISEGYNNGVTDGYNQGYYEGQMDGYDYGYQAGYNAGINEQLADKDFTNLLKSVFIAIGTFLSINLLPGISIGAIIAVPIVFGIIAFILGRRKD